MKGMKLLTQKEKIETVGGACPFTKEFIQQQVKMYMDAGCEDLAAEFIRYCYEDLGCR